MAHMHAYRARYLFLPPAAPIDGGYVTVYDDGSTLAGQTTDAQVITDLGDAALVPGLVNAHTHLELSGFDQPIGDPSQGFAAWIREVTMWRREQFATLSESERLAQRRAAVERGLRESAAAGVTSIADVVSFGWGDLQLEEPRGLMLLPFQEALGLPTNRIDGLYQQAEAFTRQPLRGVSPHAPYTLGVELLTRLARLAAERRFPLAMHLAESPEELELLHSHSGALLPLLTELGAWDPSAFPRGIRIRDYLTVLAQAHHAVVAHGNYFTEEDLDFLALHRDRFTVVYCPRTHAYFGHPRYPLPQMLARGIRVAVGTDSRASNPDLNLWDDLRFVADTFPELALGDILALAAPDVFQRICGIQTTQWLIVRFAEQQAADPYEMLFDSNARVTMLADI